VRDFHINGADKLAQHTSSAAGTAQQISLFAPEKEFDMRESLLGYLMCPFCNGELKLEEVTKQDGQSILEGSLKCVSCEASYNVQTGVPRFVLSEDYTSSFGFEWNAHARTQYDSYLGNTLSQERFWGETRWERNLQGEVIVEAGCGSGRFTEHAAGTGAVVLSFDYSSAVDVNYSANGKLENVLIVQADIYRMPFKYRVADKLFCFGVLQHTSNPEKAFKVLLKYLKPGAQIAADIYAINWKTPFKLYYLLRPITKRISHKALYGFVRRYVELMWPLARQIAKFPYGSRLNRAVFQIPDYTGRIPASDEHLRELAILDMFDTFSPYYDKPQFLSRVRRWFEDAGLENIDVHFGQNGIEARATIPGQDPGHTSMESRTRVQGKGATVNRRLKRGLDVWAALVGLTVLSPVIFAVGLSTLLALGSPVLFRQVRPGLKAKPFTLVKFRSMKEINDAYGRPLSDEERLTPLGRLLRRSSLDELPQLWNVLKGDLSLVGPRPLLMQYLERYTPEQMRRHEVKPGITGWAQVHGRNAVSWEERFALDVWYVDNWSISVDLRILWKTLKMVLTGEGISAQGCATMTEFMGSRQKR